MVDNSTMEDCDNDGDLYVWCNHCFRAYKRVDSIKVYDAEIEYTFETCPYPGCCETIE